jgi:hypothetical protein
MQAMHNKTQATVELILIDQISELVALISRDPKPANEADSLITEDREDARRLGRNPD